MLIVPALAAAIGLYFYLVSGRYVSTDNAYVGAQKVLITPEVSGKVLRIAVVEGQQLAPGEELFSIDPEPYRLAAQEAEARLARVKTDFDNLKSSAASLAKQIELSRQSVAANQADFDRKTTLLNNRISTPADLDKSRMLLMAAKSLLEQLEQQEATVRNQLLGDMDLPLERVSAVHRGDRRAPARQAGPRQHRAARPHRRHRHAGDQHPDGEIPDRRHGRVQHHRHRCRVGGGQSQGNRPHLHAPRPAGDHHGGRISLAAVARHGRGHQPGHGRAVHHPSAAERGRQLDQDRAARARCGSSSSRARTCTACAPA